MKKYLILYLIVSAALITLIIKLCSNNMFAGDDFGYAFSDDIFSTLFGIYSDTHGGGYLGYFFCQFFCFFLPIKLNIHPQDFICSPIHSIIKGIFACSVLLITANYINFYKKDISNKFFCYFFIILYFLYSTAFSESKIFEINYNFYRYVLSLLFFEVFVHFILKNVLNKEYKPDKIMLLIACVCAFITGTSSEILFFTSATFVGFIFIYNLIILFISKIKKDLKFKDEYKLNLNLNFYLPVIFLYTAIYMFINNDGYKIVANDRGMDNIVINFDILKEFIYYYVQIYFKYDITYWLIFIPVLAASFYYAYKNKEIQNVILPFFINISVLTVIFSLILCGKTNDEMSISLFSNCEYFLSHCNIVFIYKMIIIYPFILLMSYLIKNNEKSKFILYFILGIMIIYFACMHKNIINKISPFIHNLPKKEFYIAEKILRYEYLLNETPYLPYSEELKNMDLGYLRDGNENTSCKYYNNNDFLEDIFINQYYPQIYKDFESIKKGYCVSEDAYEKYIEKGGKFSEEELKDIKFQRLLNDDFVKGNIDIDDLK